MSRLTESVGTLGTSGSATDRVLDAIPERGSPTWYVLGLAFALFVGFSIYKSLLHARFGTTGADLGAYTHMFATTLDGEGWLLHGKHRVSHPYGSYWGAHFSLTLLAFLPVFALVPSVYTLLVAKSFVLAASVVVCWVLARAVLDSDRLAGLVTVSYAFNPFLWSAWSFAFQEQILIPPLTFAAYYAYRTERYLAFLGLLALVLLTNEFVLFLVAGFAVGLLVAAVAAGRLRERGPAILGAFVLVGAARAVSSAVINHFSEFGGLPYYVVADPLQPFIETARVSLLDLATIVAANPSVLIESTVFDANRKAVFFAAFLLPVAFLALADERSLFALAPFLGFAWVFTGEAKDVYYTFGAHYPLYLLPFVYIGAMGALERLSGRFEAMSIPSRAVFSGLVVAVLLLCLVAGAVSGGGHLQVPPAADEDHDRTLRAAIDTIPANASLVAQNDVYPHVATRPNASFIISAATFHRYENRYGPVTPAYVLVDTKLNPNAPWATATQVTFGDRLGGEYGLYRFEDGVQIYRRGYDGPVRGITQADPGARRYDAADLSVADARRANGRIVGVNGTAGDPVWFGPYDTFPAGNYTATYRLNVSGTGSSPVVTVDVAAGRDHEVVGREQVAPAPGWQNVTVAFSLDDLTSDVELRGIRQGDGRIVLDSVRVDERSGNATGSGSATDTANTGAGDA